MQADQPRDKHALSTLKLRQRLLEQQLARAAARRRPPAAPPPAYAEALAPVVTLCRQVVLGVANGVVERASFRPTAHEVAKCVLALLASLVAARSSLSVSRQCAPSREI